jgi:hypothetical protein
MAGGITYEILSAREGQGLNPAENACFDLRNYLARPERSIRAWALRAREHK